MNKASYRTNQGVNVAIVSLSYILDPFCRRKFILIVVFALLLLPLKRPAELTRKGAINQIT